ncbi:helix-turn-helix domain-containing protein [Hymenobacter ruricola]|uniref:Helix-turn-helix transcriptional regulator n=1 Tax=Hymenobacter ruricola TaxID=2791023 RepID=A0ABS0I0H1_9BACT|nr:helix-turn-helix domain-containing protein [Hymenobacter ruricola]MBF9220402.1 helix-turn-helix transcriptional regulator [Hymenobacter ruricola]
MAIDPLVARFAEHVATRDDPPPYVPPRQDREAILERLDTALRALGVRLRNRRHTLAQLCVALAGHPKATAVQLAEEVGFVRQTVTMALAVLLPPGYVAYEKKGRNRYYRYTRAGEDWLLPLLTGEVASAA